MNVYAEDDEIDVDITDQGEGVSCFGKMPDGVGVFVDGKCVPGDKVRARITQVNPNMLRANLVDIMTPAAERITPSCPHFNQCGGCKWQQIPYDRELEIKFKRVKDALERIGHSTGFELRPVIGSPATEGYRNKLTFTCDDDGTIGYHLPGDAEAILPINNCLLGDETMNAILHRCRETGFRKLVIRKSEHAGKYQALINNLPTKIDGLPVTIKKHLEERLLNFTYRISPEAFFQVNTRQAERMVRESLALAKPQPNEKILELYCGLGTFSLPFASRCRKLVGFEASKQAVKDAETNARLNHLSNCNFHAVNLNKAEALTFRRKLGFTPELILTDPPRAGMPGHLCDILLEIGAKRILYISCNPATLARDIERLSSKYVLDVIQPIDLFPRTEHVECVALLRQKD